MTFRKITWEDIKTPEDAFDYAFARHKIQKRVNNE